MEILNQFGFDIKLFVAQIINFVILVFLFKKFLYKALLKQIQERNTKIKKGLTDAEAAEKALAHAEAKQDEIIKKAGKEAESIMSNAKKTADEIRENTIAQTKAEADKIMLDAKEQAALELEKVKQQAENIALSIAQSVLEKSLEGLFTENEKKAIIDRNTKQLSSYKKHVS
jgi:F-type H+-transporting ATPase subunit b